MTIDSLGALIRTHAKERGDKPCITYRGTTLTYADVDERSNRVAQGLVEEGVRSQDHIAFLDKNCPEYLDVLFGGGKVNAINVAVNWRLAPREMAYTINDAQAKVLFVGEEFAAQLDEIEAQLTTVKKIVVIGSHPRHESFAEWTARFPSSDPDAQSGPDDVCFQLYTSGTTGLPKGAMLTNANMFGGLMRIVPLWQFDEDSVSIVVMPLFHIAGSGWAVVGMQQGCHSVLLREVNPAEILEAIQAYKITNAVFVPAVLQFLLVTPGVESTDFSSLRMIAYGASPISEEVLVKSLQTFKCEFYQLYGLTETTGAITMLPPEDHTSGPQERLRSAGKPFPWVEIRVVDPDSGSDVPLGEVGELWTRSPQNMKGYWNMPEETAKSIDSDGWLRTGDAGYFDADGYVYLYDRVKDMIVSGGENVYPAEIENVLMSHPDVADVAVIGVPHDRWGETVKAVVVKAAGTDPKPDEIIAYARERLAHFKCPTSLDFAETIPRNPSGKILKRELREPYWKDKERRIN